jgi:hypothetical protein
MAHLRSAWPRILCVGAALIACAAPAVAGTVALRWDPVSHPDLSGYRVYIGSTTGSYKNAVEVGTAPEIVLAELEDCTEHYFAVTALASGLESSLFSNEVSGWPRPEILGITPTVLEREAATTLIIDGVNFDPGARVQIDNPAIAVEAVEVDSCDRLRVTVAVPATASLGRVRFDVVNTDEAFGEAAGLVTVIDPGEPTGTARRRGRRRPRRLLPLLGRLQRLRRAHQPRTGRDLQRCRRRLRRIDRRGCERRGQRRRRREEPL